ncbi:hypothetical protein IQ249_24750 [Lusitaniella coriacea LEGE 07157]|uniref:Uncharacterized protein n=1 Tax=Lusitaniella coriacea LEGE 07157 TaxID=945747 RepID=A0A8J7JFW8_9CYAN|nr:hypothetical protein [Lusitaniella coriacea]MBE9119070.1 hypothetical protein [Lusitaniella coriacea LEGE 07157]
MPDHSDKIILSGREADLKATITQLLALHQLLEGKDLGQFVGEPLRSEVHNKSGIEPLHLTIFFSPEQDKMPSHGVRPHYKIPFIDRSVIGWETVKLVCGGANGFVWGRFKSTVFLEHNNIRRRMTVHGGSAKEAEKRVLALATLSEGTPVSLHTGEEVKAGLKVAGGLLYKETTRVYPYYFVLINPQRIAKKVYKEKGKGRAHLTGNLYTHRKVKIWLWTEQEPPGTKERLAEALRTVDDD